VTTEWHRVRDIDERYVIVRGTREVEVRFARVTNVSATGCAPKRDGQSMAKQ